MVDDNTGARLVPAISNAGRKHVTVKRPFDRAQAEEPILTVIKAKCVCSCERKRKIVLHELLAWGDEVE